MINNVHFCVAETEKASRKIDKKLIFVLRNTEETEVKKKHKCERWLKIFKRCFVCVSFQDVIFSCCTLIIGFLHLNIVILLHIRFIVLVLINKAEKYSKEAKRKKEIKKKKSMKCLRMLRLLVKVKET